jgi:hypothetical protein
MSHSPIFVASYEDDQKSFCGRFLIESHGLTLSQLVCVMYGSESQSVCASGLPHDGEFAKKKFEWSIPNTLRGLLECQSCHNLLSSVAFTKKTFGRTVKESSLRELP